MLAPTREQAGGKVRALDLSLGEAEEPS